MIQLPAIAEKSMGKIYGPSGSKDALEGLLCTDLCQPVR